MANSNVGFLQSHVTTNDWCCRLPSTGVQKNLRVADVTWYTLTQDCVSNCFYEFIR